MYDYELQKSDAKEVGVWEGITFDVLLEGSCS